MRYDIRVKGDSVALADVSWVYGTLPTEGGGSMRLHIRNSPDDLDVLDYALSEMDVRTTGSRLRGAMTYGVGGPMLVVKDLGLQPPEEIKPLPEITAHDVHLITWMALTTSMNSTLH